jgi:hypothetical protein
MSDRVSRKGFEKMKTRKSIHTVFEDTPLDQWTLNGNGIQCQDDARKSLEEQHADRLKLRAYHLISEVHRLLQPVDADLGSCFDTIAQHELMKSIACHVNEAAMLALIEAWLEISIEASDGKGKRRSSSNHC